jgi:hypothetical protein
MGFPIALQEQAHRCRSGEPPMVKARNAAGLPEDLVLYCARHDFGTYVMRRTGNLEAVMDVMATLM